MSKKTKPASAGKRQANGVEQNIATGPTQSVGALKLKEARQYLGGLSTPTIHRLIKRGLLRPNRALRHLIFAREELDRFLREG
jgi:helix-turn-helix protein